MNVGLGLSLSKKVAVAPVRSEGRLVLRALWAHLCSILSILYVPVAILGTACKVGLL